MRLRFWLAAPKPLARGEIHPGNPGDAEASPIVPALAELDLLILGPVTVGTAAAAETVSPVLIKVRHVVVAVLDDVDGLLARIIQHENDHLNGILYIDRGDEEFKNKTVELFKKKAERAQKKLAEKEAKKRSLEAKLAAKNAKKGK